MSGSLIQVPKHPKSCYHACQWHKNFSTRIKRCPALSWPEEIEIVPAIGKFHLSAHKPYCFPRFSLMYLKGAGHMDGEILETLWASFNKISPFARSMSLAHCQELCIWWSHERLKLEKASGSGCVSFLGGHIVSKPTLIYSEVFIEKTQNCIGGHTVQTTQGPYEEFSASLDPYQLKAWVEAAEKADIEWGKALDIYSLQMDKGWLQLYWDKCYSQAISPSW